jgi:hypothetical protein
MSIDRCEFFNIKLQMIHVATDRRRKSSHMRKKIILKLYVE